MDNVISQVEQRAGTSIDKTPMSRNSTNLALIAKFLIALVIFTHPLIYFSMIAGDAEIHLVYGMNSADGNYFEYNLGEKSAGVTSPGYMLFIASLFKTLPESIVPLAVKLTDLFFWYLLVFLTFRMIKMLSGGSSWAWTMSAVVALMPGTVYNATLGMENGIFGALFLLWFITAVRWNWFHQWSDSPSKEVALSLLMGVLLWVRPEGFVLAALAYSFRLPLLFRSLRDSSVSVITPLTRMLVSVSPVVILSALYFYFHYSQTGHLLPESGVSRVVMGSQNSIQIGAISVNTKFIRFLVFYFPLSIAMLAGLWAVLARRLENNISRINHYFFMAVLALFFVLYSSVLSAHHFSRYTIFLMPIIVVYAAFGASWISSHILEHKFQLTRNSRIMIGSVSMVVLCGLFGGEVFMRIRSGANYPSGNLWRSMNAPENKTTFSDQMLASLGNPTKLPVSLAYVEVQIRYYLDDRFVIRSLDGRVDGTLLNFVGQDGIFDHIGYIKSRNINYVMETPNFNRDKTVWSLAELNKLKPGQTLTQESVRFTNIGEGFRVEF